MTPVPTVRERLQATLDHRAVGRPLVDYMAEQETDCRLRDTLGCRSEEELLDTLGSDFYYLPGRDISQSEGFLAYYRGPALPATDAERICPFGIRFARAAGTSKFSVDHAIEGPLERAESPREILAHRWPKPSDFDYGPILDVAEAHADRILVGGFWSGILGDAVRLYGYERFLTDAALRPEMARTLVSRLTDVYLELNDYLLGLLGDKLDVFFFGNDFGSQHGLLMSAPMWHDLYFDNVRRLCDLAHAHGCAVMMHSCGAVSELIDALIEAGVDILDPVQTSARGMDPESLAARFGDRIVFHGGIDTQHVLPTGTPGEVEHHVDRIIGSLGGHGGYIACGSQLYGPDIPVENILAVYRRLGEGP